MWQWNSVTEVAQSFNSAGRVEYPWQPVSAWDPKGPGGKLFKGPLKNTKSQNNNLKTSYRYSSHNMDRYIRI